MQNFKQCTESVKNMATPKAGRAEKNIFYTDTKSNKEITINNLQIFLTILN